MLLPARWRIDPTSVSSFKTKLKCVRKSQTSTQIKTPAFNFFCKHNPWKQPFHFYKWESINKTKHETKTQKTEKQKLKKYGEQEDCYGGNSGNNNSAGGDVVIGFFCRRWQGLDKTRLWRSSSSGSRYE